MRINVTASGDVVRARLGESLDISAAAEATESLLQLSGSEGTLEIELSSLTEIDTAGVQILLALRKERQISGKSVRFLHPSPQVLEAFCLYSLERFFDETLVSAKEVP